MKRPWILAINGALAMTALALLGYAVAAVWTGWAVTAASEAPAPPAPPPTAPRQWDDRKVIVERNLFNASTLAPAVAQTMDENERYEKTRLPLRLLGTVAAGDGSWAALERLDGDRKDLVVHVGEDLNAKWGLAATVLRIERGRIVFVNAGRREELTLETPAQTFGSGGTAGGSAQASSLPRVLARRSMAPAPAAEPAPAVNAAVQRLAENRFALPRGEVENMAANPAALFAQARILPKYDQGKMIGVQLNAIRPGSLFAQVGIQDGDTVSSVNGVTVSSPEDSQRLLEQFASGGALRVTVTGRDGQVRELEYTAQ